MTQTQKKNTRRISAALCEHFGFLNSNSATYKEAAENNYVLVDKYRHIVEIVKKIGKYETS